jgi:hypothetical protein
MKKYLVAVAFILGAPQSLLAQADAFLVILDNTTNACRVVAKNDLPASQSSARYKQLGQYASKDEANHALTAMIGGPCRSRN